MGKYEGLAQFLLKRGGTRHRVRFKDVETALGFPLPKSAFSHPAWWSNSPSGHSHARSWLDIGWRTEEVDMAGRQLTFVREKPLSASQKMPFGFMAGTVTIAPGTDLTAPSGEIWNAENGILFNE